MVEGMHIEDGKPSTLDEYAKLYNIVDGYDNPDHFDIDSSFFTPIFQRPGFRIGDLIVLVRDCLERVIATASLFPDSEGRACTINIRVHPDERRRGVGTNLLKLMIGRAKESGLEKATTSIPSFRDYSLSFAKKSGFELFSTTDKLVLEDIKLHSPVKSNSAFEIREVRRDEAETWANLQNAIFKSDENYTEINPDYYLRLMGTSDFRPELSLFGLVEDTPVSYALGLVKDMKNNHHRVLYISGIGTLTQFRGRGIGNAILTELLKRARVLRITRAELLVDPEAAEAVRMYSKAGFRKTYSQHFYQAFI